MSLEHYQHEPLPNSRDYIRLVEILPAAKKDHLTVIIKAFEISYAPPYAALSYTWGSEELSKSIIANGKLLQVTENCWYALGQLRLHNLCGYYWIDAICINQSDEAEKSAQVNLMGTTYRNSEFGAVAVGRHDRGTRYLCQKLDELRMAREVYDEVFFERLGEAALERLFHCLTSLAMRPYWNRLWIVQEFALPPRVVLLCGGSCISFNDIRSLINALQKSEATKSDMNNMWEVLPMDSTLRLRSLIGESTGGLAPFGEVLGFLGLRGCNDPRDRVFGVLSLVEWAINTEPLDANYSMSVSQLASKALKLHQRHEHVPAVGRLLRILQVSAEDEGLWTMWEERRHGKERSSLHDPLRDSLRFHLLQERFEPSQKHLKNTGDVFVIADDARLRPLSDGWSCLEMHLPVSLHSPYESFAHWLTSAPILFPSAARPGDVLMEVSCGVAKGAIWTTYPDYLHGTTLVLRPMDSSKPYYSIIGHAIFPSGLPFSFTARHFYGLNLKDDIDFTLHVGADDLLLWAWQRLHWGQLRCTSLEECDEKMDVFSADFCHEPHSSYAQARPCVPRHRRE